MVDVQNSGGANGAPLLTAGDLAKRLRISIRQVHRLDKSGSVPRPLRIGACVRWNLDEVDRWLRCGAPLRTKWETLRQAKMEAGETT